MISVSSRDGREAAGGVLRVGRGRGETEHEEGEAFSFCDGGDDEDDPIIDPDIALSYIDEKIKNVLGHLQKDFEGGVSAENLGAKFGGYGSFLPMYQRSPIWSHQKSPLQTKIPNLSSPPRRSLPEGTQFRPTFSSSPSQTRQHNASSCNVIQRHYDKSSPSPDNVPLTLGAKSADVGNSTALWSQNLSPKNLSENKPANPTDQKVLKLRIKVGSDNIITQKNAEIYSGLGLDVSPSSSSGSPQSEGLSHTPLDVSCVSPVSILQIMTTFLEDGERMLSPLSDNLLYLIRKEKPHKEDNGNFNKSEHFLPSVQDGTTPIHDDGKFSRDKRLKSEKKIIRNELEKEKDDRNEIMGFSKEVMIDPTSRKKQVSDFSSSADPHFDSKGLPKKVEEEYVFHLESSEGTVKDKSEETGPCQPSAELGFTGNAGEYKTTNIPCDISTPLIKNAYIHSAPDSIKTSLNIKESKTANPDGVDPPKQKLAKKIFSHEKDGMRESSQEHHRRKKKAKETSAVDPSSSSKNRNKPYEDGYPPKEKSEYCKKQNPSANSHNGCTNFILEANIGEDDEPGSTKICSDDRGEEYEMVNRKIGVTSAVTKEKVSNKNTDGALKSEASAGSFGGDRSNADAALCAVAPAMIKENWVCCDKCQKWRLLPPTTNTEDLPEKWICSMLDWLPAMNRCSFSEDETRTALIAHYYQVSNTSLVDLQNSDLNKKNDSLHTLSHEIKKKNTTKNIVSTTDQENSSFSTYLEKSSNAAGRIRSLYDDKHAQKLGEKRRISSHSSDGAKSKRVLENDSSKNPEQVEECMHDFNGDSISGRPVANKKANSISDNGFSFAAVVKNGPGSDHIFPKDVKFGSKDGTEAFGGKRKPKIYFTTIDQSLNVGKVENTGASNKKKGKGLQVDEANSGSFSAEGNRLNGNNILTKEETSDVVRLKEKKQKSTKYEGRESNGVKVNAVEVNGVCLKDRNVTKIHKISAPSQNSAVISSSPKIQGYHKSKVILRERKSSPVQSISSSPNIISSMDKAASSHIRIPINSEFKDAGFVDNGSTGRCSLDDEFSVRNNPLRLSRMDKNENTARLISVESPVLDFQEVNNNQLPVALAKHRPEQPFEFAGQNIPSYCKSKASGISDRTQKCSPEEKLKERNQKFGGKSTCNTNKISEEKKRRSLIEDNDGANSYKIPVHEDLEIASENQIEGRPSKRAHFNEIGTEPTGSGKSQSFPVSASDSETLLRCQQHKENKSEKLKVDKQRKREDRQNETKKAYESETVISAKELQSRGTIKKEVRGQAIIGALREAKNLKHVADRLKNSGLDNESRGIYFQAALKFLHSASMSEYCSDSTSHGDIQSIELYRDTAKYCEFCAHEFEKVKDMASVALAYKCAEVAWMRVVYGSHTTASRDCHELQVAPLTIIPGESPCSSASDVDNVNNNLMADKVVPSKGTGSPPVLSNHVIAGRNRPNFLRLLNFAQDVHMGMDSSRRSQAAFAAAVGASGGHESGEQHVKEGLALAKKALDFGFQDVDELLRLIRVAVEAMAQP